MSTRIDLKEMTFGEELVRVNFAKDDNVSVVKQEYAKLIDSAMEYAEKLHMGLETNPTSIEPDVIQEHMKKVHEATEAIRCVSEATKYLELACFYHVKALTV